MTTLAPATVEPAVFEPEILESVTMRDGATLRLARWPTPDGARGAVLVLPGRAECVEKYAETAAGLFAAGLQVFALDWRNQGLSERPHPNPQKHHVEDFRVLRDDLAEVIAHNVRPAAAGPLVALAHSMGGLVATLYAAEEPDGLAGLIVAAPMYKIALAPWPRGLIRGLAELACRLGAGRAYAIGQGDYDPRESQRFAGNPLTSDRQRYAVLHDAFARRPELRVGGVTFGWLKAALAASDLVLSDAVLKRLSVPVLLLVAPEDRVVDAAAILDVGARLPNARVALFPGAGHELLMERDELRRAVWASIAGFLTERLGPTTSCAAYGHDPKI